MELILALLPALGWGIQPLILKTIGVSKTIPLSTGLQLVGAAVLSVLLFGE